MFAAARLDDYPRAVKILKLTLAACVLFLTSCSRRDDAAQSANSPAPKQLQDQAASQQQAIANAAAQRRKEAERNAPSATP